MRVMHERRGIPAAFVFKFKGDAWRTSLRVLLLQPLVLCLQEQQPQPDLSAITDFFHQPHFVWEPDNSSQGPGQNECQENVLKSFVIHSPMAAAKSIVSPTRCLTSLSQALGLVP
jgi:hypothetical protein